MAQPRASKSFLGATRRREVWAGAVEISSVEVSVDHGKTWALAQVEAAPDSHSWWKTRGYELRTVGFI